MQTAVAAIRAQVIVEMQAQQRTKAAAPERRKKHITQTTQEEKHFDRTKLFSVPELKYRGWTDAAIRRFAPEPDDTRLNPFYKCAAPMKFYLIARVKRIEVRKSWIAWKAGSAVRKQSAAAAVSTKEQKLQEYVDAIEIVVPEMGTDELKSHAIQHYNAWWTGTGKRAHDSDSSEFLDRISVNYLRHELTSYEEHLDKIAGKTGAYNARTDLRSAIYDAIGDAYLTSRPSAGSRTMTAQCGSFTPK